MNLVNPTYYRLELRRLRRDYVTLFFTIALPAFFFLIFGASPEYGDEPVRNGNVAMWVLINMTAYGAVTATAGLGGAVALERMQGWSRQIGLTPLTDRQYVSVKATVSATMAAIVILVIYALGFATGAEAPLREWLLSGAILLAGSLVFALYGLNIGLAFRSEAAVSAAGGSLVILSFLGNIFIPLGGWQLTVARFTPLYGYAALARRPLTGGASFDQSTGEVLAASSIWADVANMAGWFVVLATVSVWLVARSRSRQA